MYTVSIVTNEFFPESETNEKSAVACTTQKVIYYKKEEEALKAFEDLSERANDDVRDYAEENENVNYSARITLLSGNAIVKSKEYKYKQSR